MTQLTKNYGLVAIEKLFMNDPNGIGVGYFNEHSIEFEAQSRNTIEKYQDEKGMYHCEIMTKKQLQRSVETTGECTI